IEFVDNDGSGLFRMTLPAGGTLKVDSGLAMMEVLGLIHGHDCFTRSDGTQLGPKCTPILQNLNTDVAGAAVITTPLRLDYREIEAGVNPRFNTLPLKVRADYVPLTDTTVQINLALQFDPEGLSLRDIGGVLKATVSVYSRVTTMARKPILRFEDTLEF